MVPFDRILLCDADTILEYENEPSLEVLQEVTIYSCVGCVRITDDIPLLNWISHFAMKMRTGRGKSQWRNLEKRMTRQILSDAWESTDLENLFDNPLHTVIVETKVALEDQPRMLVKDLWKLSVENSTSCMRILKLTDTWEVVRNTRCLFCMEKRQNHVRRNSESESEELLREPWQEKPGLENLGGRSRDGNIQGQNR